MRRASGKSPRPLWKSPWAALIATLLAIAALTSTGPAEKSLGENVRVVYLHGAWVWAALAAFVVAASLGLVGLVARLVAPGHRLASLNGWSRAMGRAGLLFWISYLPISLWAMQTNWNGLFLAEPRWRLAAIFALGGTLLQLGLALLEDPAWASAGNIVYLLALFLALQNTPNVMHPSSPIFSSDAWRIQVFFVSLFVLTLLAAWQVARLWKQLDDRMTQAGD